MLELIGTKALRTGCVKSVFGKDGSATGCSSLLIATAVLSNGSWVRTYFDGIYLRCLVVLRFGLLTWRSFAVRRSDHLAPKAFGVLGWVSTVGHLPKRWPKGSERHGPCLGGRKLGFARTQLDLDSSGKAQTRVSVESTRICWRISVAQSL